MTCSVDEQLAVRPVAAEVATHTINTHKCTKTHKMYAPTHCTAIPLLLMLSAIETVPSAFSTQPYAPAGHEHLIAGAVELHWSAPYTNT